jgi:Anti-sigma-K factor rskA/Putative zinc-finger
MTVDSNTHPLDDLAVYALDALEPAERDSVDAHLGRCASCRAELDRHLDTLARMTSAEDPPAHLWDRIAGRLPTVDLGAVGPPPSLPTLPSQSASSSDTGSTPPEVDDPEAVPGQVLPFDPEHPRHRRGGRRAGTGSAASKAPWLVAAAASVAAVVGIGVVSTQGADDDRDVGDLAETAAGADGSMVVQLTGADGRPHARVVVTTEGEGYVLLDDLPVLDEDESYQLWKMNGIAPVSLGVLGDGSAEAVAVAMPSDSTSFAISQEPEEGVPTPTGTIVADGESA